MLSVECNYEIYDKELLIIIRAFEEWRSECADTSSNNFIKVLFDHRNLETFMTIKQLNRRQVKWIEFLAEFNFQITYKSETKDIKSNSFTRRSQNLFADNFDERRQFNNQTILKFKNLNFEVRNAIRLDEKIHQLKIAIIRIAMMTYFDLVKVMTFETFQQDFDDENFDSKNESMTKASISQPFAIINSSISMTEEPVSRPFSVTNSSINQQNLVTDSLVTNRSSVIDSSVEFFDQAQNDTLQYSDFLLRIQATYKKDSILQAIMKAKNDDDRRIPTRLIKKDIRLKLSDCEIKFDLLWIKKRLHMFKKKSLQIDVIKHIHEFLQKEHVERIIIYERLSIHYYWQNMTASIARYVKTCHHCRRIKVYKNVKQELLKSLPISDRYFKEIIVDFIISLPICKRNDKNYQHIIIVIDRLFKIKRFAALKFLNVDSVIQAFINWIWRIEDFFEVIISDRSTQFTAEFWKRFSKRFRSHLKWFTVWHSKIDDQIEIANAAFKKYLRTYCNYQQNDWYDLLSFVEFEVNSASSSFTTVASFLAIKEYISRFDLKPLMSIKDTPTAKREMKNADAFVKKIQNFQKYLRSQLIWFRIKQKKQVNARRHSAIELKIENKVMLNRRFIETMRFNKSLNWKNLEPYSIKKVINNIAYQLDLSESMNEIYSVFHSWLLHLNESNPLLEQHDSDFESIVIAHEFEWKIEKILDFKLYKKKLNSITREKKLLQYRIKFTEWNTYNQTFKWKNFDKLKNARDAVADFHHRYFDKFESHSIYQRFADWKSPNDD